MPKFVIIDGHSFAHRAYHAVKDRPTEERILVGMPAMLAKVIQEEKPDFFTVVFDPQNEGNFRTNIYPDYKANREESPQDLKDQIRWMTKLCELLGYPTLTAEGYEGDDVVGTLAKKGEKAGFETIVYTSDKDMAQLVSDKVSVFNTGKKIYVTPENFESIYEIPIENFIDYLSIEGDDIDNIPGIPLCGPKTTKDLINNIGSVETILANKEKIKEVIKRNKDNIYKSICENEEQMLLNKRLATIVTDLDIDLKLKDIKFKKIQNESIEKYLNHYGLNRKRQIPQFIETLNTHFFLNEKQESPIKTKPQSSRRPNP